MVEEFSTEHSCKNLHINLRTGAHCSSQLRLMVNIEALVNSTHWSGRCTRSQQLTNSNLLKHSLMHRDLTYCWLECHQRWVHQEAFPNGPEMSVPDTNLVHHSDVVENTMVHVAMMGLT